MTTKIVQVTTPHGDPKQLQTAIITLIYGISTQVRSGKLTRLSSDRITHECRDQ